MGTSADRYILPEGIQAIESRAFAELTVDGAQIQISDTTDGLVIAPDAFEDSDVVIVTPAGSEAAAWADENDVVWTTSIYD